MDRDEILRKSRQENKNQDLYKNEIEAKASTVGVLAATALATLFFVVQLLAGQGINFGLYAIPFSVGAAQFTMKAIYLRQGRAVLFAVLYAAAALVLSFLHIYSLVRV